jgi:hypothetical protein
MTHKVFFHLYKFRELNFLIVRQNKSACQNKCSLSEEIEC